MPRRSAEALAVKSHVIIPGQRPAAPDGMHEEAAKEWVAITNTMPVDWFTREMWPLLTALCNATAILKRITVHLDEQNDVGARSFSTLCKMQVQYSDLIARISTKLKLTPQSRHNTLNKANSATKEAVKARLAGK